MDHNLHQTYSDLTKEKLFKVILTAEEYTPEAIEIARKVVKEKGWMNELNSLLEEQQKENEQKEIEYENEIAEKADYYKMLVDVKAQKCSFEVRIADIPKLESILNEKEIEFFREDKNIGPQIDVYPTQTYYFKAEDSDTVDQIVKDIGLITAPYFDYKPFFKKEIIIIAVVTLIILITIAILS